MLLIHRKQNEKGLKLGPFGLGINRETFKAVIIFSLHGKTKWQKMVIELFWFHFLSVNKQSLHFCHVFAELFRIVKWFNYNGNRSQFRELKEYLHKISNNTFGYRAVIARAGTRKHIAKCSFLDARTHACERWLERTRTHACTYLLGWPKFSKTV